MSNNLFADKIKALMSSRVPSELLGGLWYINQKPYPHIYLDVNDNFIDGRCPKKCNVKGDLFSEDIEYHKGLTSLNSSQALCLNFFIKFFERSEWEKYLLQLLEKCEITVPTNNIANAIFEYIAESKEETNFDFYLIFDNGDHISFEIKYTENNFGQPSNSIVYYREKWERIQKGMVDECPFLDCSMDMFHKNYQINRNIIYGRTNDSVVFLTPRANNSKGILEGREYIDELHEKYSNICNIYWEDVVPYLLEIVQNEPDLYEYYSKFKMKYIDILSLI